MAKSKLKRRARACDCCGEPVNFEATRGGSAHHTDAEACDGTDGPGFYLCGRAACVARRDALGVEARRTLYAAQRAANEQASPERMAERDGRRPMPPSERSVTVSPRLMPDDRRRVDDIARRLAASGEEGADVAVVLRVALAIAERATDRTLVNASKAVYRWPVVSTTAQRELKADEMLGRAKFALPRE